MCVQRCQKRLQACVRVRQELVCREWPLPATEGCCMCVCPMEEVIPRWAPGLPGKSLGGGQVETLGARELYAAPLRQVSEGPQAEVQ